jgi:predicted nucleotidyltransferase component of viral defense system
MVGLTRALITRHALGRADAYDAALLDVAQDHLLYLVASAGLFDGAELVFKGGTSLRKYRLGNEGRFSTDLDFAAPADDTVIEVCDTIDGATIGGFELQVEPARGDGRHWRLRVAHPALGTPAIASSLQFARRPLVLRPERLAPVALPIHVHYGFDMPEIPIVAEPEACAEKLARYRRVSLARDLYDLNHFALRAIDESLVRRLWVLKVWADVVDDGRGARPLDPSDLMRERRVTSSRPTRSACSRDPWT